MKMTSSTFTVSGLRILIGAMTVFVSYRIAYFCVSHLTTWAKQDPVHWVPLLMLLTAGAMWTLMMRKPKS